MKPFGTIPLPPELVDMVFGYCDPEHDATLLARWARCSHAWHERIIPLLYSHIHLYSDRQMVRLFSDISLEKDQDGKLLPCPTLTDIPVDRIGNGKGQAPRKLAHFLHVRHVSLHYVPGADAVPYDPEIRGKRILYANADGELKDVLRLFPHVRGIALGRGFLAALLRHIAPHHPTPCDNVAHAVSDTQWVKRGWHGPNREGIRFGRPTPCDNVTDAVPDTKWVEGDWYGPDLEGIRKFVRLFSLRSVPQCWDLDDMPPGMCGQLQHALLTALIIDDAWRFAYRINTHSTFPRAHLAPWTRLRRSWRHFIHVETGAAHGPYPSSYIKPENARARRERAEDHTDAYDGDDDGDDQPDGKAHAAASDDLLWDLAEDVYTIASETLESIAYSEKPRRRNMIYSGLSNAQVRAVEQKFVTVVREEFDDPDDVLIEPLPERYPSSDEDNDDDDDDDDLYYGYTRSHNLYGDGGSDPESDDAVRDYQPRVEMFDFFHAPKTSKCTACGRGEGVVYSRWGSPEKVGF